MCHSEMSNRTARTSISDIDSTFTQLKSWKQMCAPFTKPFNVAFQLGSTVCSRELLVFLSLNVLPDLHSKSILMCALSWINRFIKETHTWKQCCQCLVVVVGGTAATLGWARNTEHCMMESAHCNQKPSVLWQGWLWYRLWSQIAAVEANQRKLMSSNSW